jgi:hypothetical protein
MGEVDLTLFRAFLLPLPHSHLVHVRRNNACPFSSLEERKGFVVYSMTWSELKKTKGGRGSEGTRRVCPYFLGGVYIKD